MKKKIFIMMIISALLVVGCAHTFAEVQTPMPNTTVPTTSDTPKNLSDSSEISTQTTPNSSLSSPSDITTSVTPALKTSLESNSWTFVVFGDTRDALKTTTGISPYLNTIAKNIAEEKPDLVLFGGDLINGGDIIPPSPIEKNYTAQFNNWMNAVSPIYNYSTQTGIPLYVIRGNHEDGISNILPIPALLTDYREMVAAGMPTNGPAGEEKLTYSFIHKGAKFIALDEYYPHDGVKETVNQSWLEDQLTNDTKPFMFVIGHAPAYNVSTDIVEYKTGIGIHPAARDIFWDSLVKNNVAAYFCGHVHTYVRAESRGVQQVLVGNGGAPEDDFDPSTVDPTLTLDYPTTAVNASDQKFGYLVVTVHEDNRTYDGVEKEFNPGTGEWEVGDSFSYPIR
jgi:hypothetical protein